MSFLDDLVDFGSSALDWLGSNSIGSSLARTALTGYALNQVTSSINKDNEAAKNTTNAVDPGVRLQVSPDTEYRIPLVYGNATLSGTVTDAVMTSDNKTMYYCIAICEKTGAVNLGAGSASTFTFVDVYWDDARLIFHTDGQTVSGFVDKANNFCSDYDGKIKIWCFAGNSTMPVVPQNYSNTSLANAYTIMPNWTTAHMMSDLVFAIIKVDYDATAGVKGLGTVKFNITNSMNQPGDCLYDYMTNQRYGAGIDPTEINS